MVVVLVPVSACVKKKRKEDFSGVGGPGIVVDVVAAYDRNDAGVDVVESVGTDVAVADGVDIVMVLNDDSIEVEEGALR